MGAHAVLRFIALWSLGWSWTFPELKFTSARIGENPPEPLTLADCPLCKRFGTDLVIALQRPDIYLSGLPYRTSTVEFNSDTKNTTYTEHPIPASCNEPYGADQVLFIVLNASSISYQSLKRLEALLPPERGEYLVSTLLMACLNNSVYAAKRDYLHRTLAGEVLYKFVLVKPVHPVVFVTVARLTSIHSDCFTKRLAESVTFINTTDLYLSSMQERWHTANLCALLIWTGIFLLMILLSVIIW